MKTHDSILKFALPLLIFIYSKRHKLVIHKTILVKHQNTKIEAYITTQVIHKTNYTDKASKYKT